MRRCQLACQRVQSINPVRDEHKIVAAPGEAVGVDRADAGEGAGAFAAPPS